jgi:hypothetical protein
MQSLVSYWLYVWSLSPGICVLLLGVEALIITLIPPDKLQRWGVRVLAVGLCFFLVLGELRAVRHEREETYEQHRQDMQDILSRFGGLHQDVVALESNVAASQATRYLPTDSLKRRALDLSNEILRFLISREVPPEGFGQGGYGEGPYGGSKPSDSKAYDSETISTFVYAFEPRVIAIHDEFKRKRLTDKVLEAEYVQPTNRYSIRAIAERIALLATRLPS